MSVNHTVPSRYALFLRALLLFALPANVLPAAAGSSPPLIVEHGARDRGIALTFDACPTGRPDEYDEKVIEALQRDNVRATLFLSGRWVEKNPEKAKYLAGQPQFELGAHSYYHPHLLEKDDARVLREMKRTQAIIKKTTGTTPRYFRPPYGEVDDRVARLAREAGLVTIQYDISSGDPDPNLAPDRIVRSILKSAKGGSIIVFHMNKNGAHTAELLPLLVKGLREKGFALVTVGDLLEGSKDKDARKEKEAAGKPLKTEPDERKPKVPIARESADLRRDSTP